MFRARENASEVFRMIADKYGAFYNFTEGYESVLNGEMILGESAAYLDFNVKLNYMNE